MNENRSSNTILYLMGGMYALDVYSAVMSSPWTAYNFGGDEKSVEALWVYVTHAVVLTLFFTGTAAIHDRSPAPLIGGVIGGAYMYWLYLDAVAKGTEDKKSGWSG